MISKRLIATTGASIVFLPRKAPSWIGALGQLKTVIGLLGDARGVSLQRGLGILASDLAQLAGEVFFDTNDYATAQSCYTFAAAAAKEAARYDLWASALVRNAFLPIYDQQYWDAIPLLHQAERIAACGDTSLER